MTKIRTAIRSELPDRPNAVFGMTPASASANTRQREGQEHVHGPGDDRVEPAAEVAGDDAEEGADNHREHGRHERDQQRVPGADDDPGEQVPAGLRFHAERVVQADPAERALGALERGIDQIGMEDIRILHEVRADDGEQDEEHDDDAAGHRHLVPAQPYPGDLPDRSLA